MVCAVVPGVPLNIFSFFPGFWILKFLKENLFLNIFGGFLLEMVFVFFGNFIYWLIHVKISLVLAIEIIICTTCFVKFIKYFEMKANRFRYERSELKLFYWQIQLLVDSSNTVIKTQLVVYAIAFGFTQVSAALQILRLGITKKSSLSFVELAGEFWISTFNIIVFCNVTVVINLLFGCCAEVHHVSRKVNFRLKRRQSLKMPLQHKLFLNSISVLKIKFGGTNFLEKLTPVVFQAYLVERLVDILLLR